MRHRLAESNLASAILEEGYRRAWTCNRCFFLFRSTSSCPRQSTYLSQGLFSKSVASKPPMNNLPPEVVS
jgi:hypothetical protein